MLRSCVGVDYLAREQAVASEDNKTAVQPEELDLLNVDYYWLTWYPIVRKMTRLVK